MDIINDTCWTHIFHYLKKHDRQALSNADHRLNDTYWQSLRHLRCSMDMPGEKVKSLTNL